MMENISAYIQARKSWSIKNVLANYFRAINLYANIHREYHAGKDVSFDKLRQLSVILYSIKEELHLIYRRLQDPRKNLFEKANKYTPNQVELSFINNVGLLFHKAMVARELKYMLEYYETEAEEDYLEVKKSLDDYMQRLLALFDKGISIIQPFLRSFQEDVIVLSFFLENSRYVESVLGVELESLLKEFGDGAVHSAYIKVSRYFIDSGWLDRAKKVLYDALKLDPGNEEIRDMLVQYG